MLKQRLITAALLILLVGVGAFALSSAQVGLIFAAFVLAGAWEWSGLTDLGGRLGRIFYVMLVSLALLGGWWLVQRRVGLMGVLIVALAWWSAVAMALTRYRPGARRDGRTRPGRAPANGAGRMTGRGSFSQYPRQPVTRSVTFSARPSCFRPSRAAAASSSEPPALPHVPDEMITQGLSPEASANSARSSSSPVGEVSRFSLVPVVTFEQLPRRLPRLSSQEEHPPSQSSCCRDTFHPAPSPVPGHTRPGSSRQAA